MPNTTMILLPLGHPDVLVEFGPGFRFERIAVAKC